MSIEPDGTACLGALVSNDPQRGVPLRGPTSIAAHEGRLSGVLVGTEGARMPMTCAPGDSGIRSILYPPSRPVLLTRLRDGTLVAAIASDDLHWTTLRLDTAGWATETEVAIEEPRTGPLPIVSLVAGSDRAELFAWTETYAALWTAEGHTDVDPTTLTLAGPPAARTTLMRRGDAHARLVLSSAGRTRSVAAPSAGPTVYAWSGLAAAGAAALLACPHVEHRRDYGTDHCEARALALRAPLVSSASFPVAEHPSHHAPRAAIEASARAVLALQGGSTPTLAAFTLDARHAEPLGPPLPASRPGSTPLPLAIALDPPRIVWVDFATARPERPDVRVARLDEGVWVDVADLWGHPSLALAALFDGDDVVVLGVDRTGQVASARLHAGVWSEIAGPLVAMRMPE